MTVPPDTRTAGARLKAYFALTKPRIIELLLITTVPAMILAAAGWPGTGLVLGTVVGGALSAGGANAINNVVDRDIDARMRRTVRRPLPAEAASPREALILGAVLGVVGFVVLWLVANLAAALLATGALGFYVLVYSLLLKRTTAQNIVIGGAAGAVPAIVGWAAVTGSVALPGWLLFAVIFYWTPPHFWALALRFRTDYEEAGVPMLPVVVGERATAVQIVLYSFVLAGMSFLLQPAAGLGKAYTGAAVIGALAFVSSAAMLLRDSGPAMAVFRISNVYLAVLFAAVALDVLISDPALPSAPIAWIGATVVIAGCFAIIVASRARSVLDWIYLLLPAAGAITIAVAVLARI